MSRNSVRARDLLSNEAQVLWRLLRKLKCSDDAMRALLDTLVALPRNAAGNAIREKLHNLLPALLKQPRDPKNPVQQPPFNMALATEMAILKAFPHHDGTSDNIHTEKGRPQHLPSRRQRRDKARSSPPAKVSVLESLGESVAVVTDASSAGSEMEDNNINNCDEVARSPAGQVQAAKECWRIVLEAFHLQLAMRTTAKNRVYEIYQLSSIPYISSNMHRVQKAIETELEILQDRMSRVYAHLGQDELCVLLCIGKGGPSGNKPREEFVAVFNPGSSLFALATKKAPSRSPLTRYVLAALDAGLTTKSPEDIIPCGALPEQVSDLVGFHPRELLKAAQSAVHGKSTGRFMHYASKSSLTNPLEEITKAATSSTLSFTAEEERLAKIGLAHGRKIAHMAAESTGSKATLVAMNQTGVMLDHSALAKSTRKRARDEDFGQGGDCPTINHISWKWSGQTLAASACWEEENGPTVEEALPTQFSCAVTLRGANVFEGLRALIDAGLAQAPLPNFVRDAPSMGSMTVTVNEQGDLEASPSEC